MPLTNALNYIIFFRLLLVLGEKSEIFARPREVITAQRAHKNETYNTSKCLLKANHFLDGA
ncbi:hypothetical protein GCHA_0989 [Paraglaciecola chathamensis S18K6]|uniref:Uncharacterized protein n=1 Tax=Paraglaciecola chathamensis S18K6 TaxID=1127672 RepID=A0AAV3UV65_9ALTE|nr:hypothetical protein GCHA_0989 [Paraglaciecola chathamensis S18K6]